MNDHSPSASDAASHVVTQPENKTDEPRLPPLPPVPVEPAKSSESVDSPPVVEPESSERDPALGTESQTMSEPRSATDPDLQHSCPQLELELGMLDALAKTHAALESKLDQLHEAFDTKLAVDEVKDRQIDTLHREVQGHRQDLLGKALRPLVSGLVRLHDNLGRSAESLANAEQSLGADEAAKLLEEFREDVEILLEENGIGLFSEPVDTLEPRRQTVRKTLPCRDSTQVGQIARRVRPGFERDGLVLQKERVDVYVASEAEPP